MSKFLDALDVELSSLHCSLGEMSMDSGCFYVFLEGDSLSESTPEQSWVFALRSLRVSFFYHDSCSSSSSLITVRGYVRLYVDSLIVVLTMRVLDFLLELDSLFL